MPLTGQRILHLLERSNWSAPRWTFRITSKEKTWPKASESPSSAPAWPGKAHAAAYRTASALYCPALPPIRLVSIGDVNAEFGSLAARRFGYERNDTSWQAIAEADDIDVVSVVIANSLHREVVEGLLAAGKHVLCEKPLSDTLDDARAMADGGPQRVDRSPGSASPSAAPRASPTSATSSSPATLGQGAALQRPLLDRLRLQPARPDELALSRAARAPARSPTSAATWPTSPSSCAAT